MSWKNLSGTLFIWLMKLQNSILRKQNKRANSCCRKHGGDNDPKTSRFTLSLLFSLMPLSASELEIVVIQEDFSVNNWQRLSLSDSDTVFGFDITDFRYRSAPFAMTILPDYPGNQDEWIISPELDLSGSDQTPVLQFYEDSDFWFSSNATHELYYTTVANPTADDFISRYQLDKCEPQHSRDFSGSR
jgi:hypothetical protein